MIVICLENVKLFYSIFDIFWRWNFFLIFDMISLNAIFINRTQVRTLCPILYNHLHLRLKSSKKNSLTASKSKGTIDTNVKSLGEKVKEATRTTLYFGVTVLGLAVTGYVLYSVSDELFSRNSPNSLYSKASKKCIEHTQVSDKLGYPISAYGEETRKGRRQHVSHANYLDNEGRKHIRMKFHLKGTAHSGIAHLDMVQTESGSYEYKYLFVEVDDMFKSVIVIEDNRNKFNTQLPSTVPSVELKL